MAPQTYSFNSASALVESFASYKDHFNARTSNTGLELLELLRERFPDHHVACTAIDFDFKGYAHAGKAQIRPNFSNDNTDLYNAVRRYEAPLRQLDKNPGQLADYVLFGRYAFTWREHEFFIFRAAWRSSCWGSDDKHWYVLAPKACGTMSDGHHSLTDELLLEVGKWSSEVHNEIYVFDDSDWVKSSELWKSVQGSSWDDVIMDPKMKQSLIEDVQGFFENKDLYSKYKVPWKRGIILHGVPGNGKTISIKALMNYLSNLPEPVPSLYVKSLDNKCNMPQYSVSSIFAKARKMAPCLLVFEDLDSLIVEKVRSYFLNEVDGLESNDGILMIGSTNHLSRLDPAISKRPSRFDRKYHFRIPSRGSRIAYCDYWRSKLAANVDVDFPEDVGPIIADITEGFSYAYLKELMVMALLTVARGGKGVEDAAAAETGWDVVSATSTPAEPADDKAALDARKPNGKAEQKAVGSLKDNPVAIVPDHLKDNVFLRVVQQQVKILLHEMDNTDEEESGLPVLSGDGSEDSRPGCTHCL